MPKPRRQGDVGAAVAEAAYMTKILDGEEVAPGELGDVVLAALKWYVKLPVFESALCAETDPELFFPEHGKRNIARMAKNICSQCDLRVPCRDFALEHKIDYGIWGGTTPQERKTLAKLMENG